MLFKKLHQYVAIALGLIILVPFKLKPIIIFLFLCYSIFQFFNFKENKINKKTLVSLIALSLVLISYLFSFVYSLNLLRATNYFIRSIPLFLIPLSFSLLKENIREEIIKLFLKTFIISNAIYVILMFAYIIDLGYLTKSIDLYYFYSYITYEFFEIGDHPIYLSVQFALSILFLIKFNINKKLKFLLFFILTIGLFFLSRKGVIFSFIIMLSIYLFNIINNRKRLMIYLSLIILCFCSSLFVPQIRARYVEIYEKQENNNQTSTGIRLLLWENSIELIKNNLVLGYGIGDAQEVLTQQMHTKGHLEIAAKKSNCHNQYLQFLLSVGVIGLGLFIITLIYCFIQFRKNHNLLGVVVLLFFVLLFTTESFLDRQNGIIIFSMFMSILIIGNNNFNLQKNE